MTFPAERPGVDPHRSESRTSGGVAGRLVSTSASSKPGDGLDTVTGFHLVNGWGRSGSLFCGKYSRPFDDFHHHERWQAGVTTATYRFRSRSEAAGPNLQFLARYKTKKDEADPVKVGISAVSRQRPEEPRRRNPGLGLRRVRRETREKWERELSRIEIEGSPQDKETFYTAMYHCFMTPNLYQDVTGEYRGLDHNIHQPRDSRTTRSSRSGTPTAPSIRCSRSSSAPRCRHDQLDAGPLRPERRSPAADLGMPGNETWCMIGYHAVPVIADAYLKGVQGLRSRAGLSRR